MTWKQMILIVALFTCAACVASCTSSGTRLAGTEWRLTSMSGRALIEGTEMSLTFDETTFSGSAGCNTYGGSYSADAVALRGRGIYATEMGCMEPEGVLEQEQAYLAALATVVSYRVENGRLEMHDEAGSQILTFAPLGGN